MSFVRSLSLAALAFIAISLLPSITFALGGCETVITITQFPANPTYYGTATFRVDYGEVQTTPPCFEGGYERDLETFQFTINGSDVSTYFTKYEDHAIGTNVPLLVDVGTNTFRATIAGWSTTGVPRTDADEEYGSVAPASLPNVSVTPDGGTATPAPSLAGRTQVFSVANSGNASATYALQVLTCTGGISACSVPATVTVAPGASAPVTVTYISGAVGAKGTIELKGSIGLLSDIGTVYASVTALANANTRVLVGEVNPGTTINRASCLVFSIGRDLASECGALRVTHALPMVRTLNKARSPTLVYYGDQVRGPVLATHVLLADTATIPDSVQLNVKEVLADGSTTQIAGLPRAYAGTTWAGNRAQRVSAVLPVTGTRILTYQVEVKLLYAGAWRSAAPIVTGEAAIVDRIGSRFGAGWWLAGVERLYPGQQGGAVLWVAGDGSTRKYVRSGTVGTDTTYLAEQLTRPDTLFRDALGVYRRSLPSGGRVYFDGTGLHTKTVNRLGHTTRFVWGAVSGEPRLDSLVVPAPTGATRFYHFRYDASGALYSILAPSAREVLVARTVINGVPGRGVERITDPDLKYVSFAFQPWGLDYAYGARIDRRGTRTDFVNEANAPTVAYASTPTGTGETVRQDFRTVTGIGADLTAGALSVDSTYFRHVNPLLAVTKIWTDRLGAPTRIVNALGHSNTVRRDDWRFPASVTRVEYPVLAADQRQRVQTATFDARGNLKTSIDVNPYGTDGNNRDAVTRYEYDNTAWPSFVTRIVPPERDSVVIVYDADGNRSSQRDARGDSTLAYFYYGNPWKLLSSASQSGVKRDSLDYGSPLGNLIRSRTALGVVTTIIQDSLGRDTLVKEPTNTAQTIFRYTQTTYDVMDQVKLARTTGEMVPSTTGDTMSANGAQTVKVENWYDEEGNLKSVDRWSTPDIPIGGLNGPTMTIGKITNRWDYDGLHRKIREYAPDKTPDVLTDNPYDETRYDLAGNEDTVITRNGNILSMSYDAIGRLKVRRVPQVTIDSSSGIIQNPIDPFGAAPFALAEKNTPYPRYPNDPANSQYGYTVAKDSSIFTYDELGNLTRADNRDALVRRGYYLNGLIKEDTLTVRTLAELTAGGDMATVHKYVLGYKYDLNGRRTELKHPLQLAPSGTQNTTKYEYDVAGSLAAITDALGFRYAYEYNARGELTKSVQTDRPSSYEKYRYDLEGNQIGDTISDGGTLYRSTAISYLPGGKILNSKNGSYAKDTLWASYTGLGQVLEGAQQTSGPYASFIKESRFYESDALGSVYRTGSSSQYYTNTGGGGLIGGSSSSGTTPMNIEQRAYERGTGRLSWVQPDYSTSVRKRDTTYYDAAGNVRFETTRLVSGANAPIRDRVYYYGADNTLRAADSRSYVYQGGSFQSAFEEYRYDALGRRVLVRARRHCEGSVTATGLPCRLDWVRRTVWDGSAELYEIQMPLDANAENDATTLTLPAQIAEDGLAFDPNPSFGRVAYTHALGIDRPRSIIRMGYVRKTDEFGNVATASATFAPFAINPFWDVRGTVDMGMYADIGFAERCQSASGSIFCVALFWPGNYFGYERPVLNTSYWNGTLLQDKADAAGINYRRNRYYDPSTGRFTQEDPIGLAGGMNLYGFAGGDPVNFSDPFGLCPIPPQACIGVALVAAGTALQRVATSPAAQRIAERSSQLSIRAASQVAQVQRQMGNILRELSEHDHLSAARLENTRRLQTGFNHTKEVTDFANGLRNSVVRLKGIMSNEGVSTEIRQEAAQLLSRTSRLLDDLQRALR